jgi:hypothetical protein
MAARRKSPLAAEKLAAVTPERFTRLYRMVQLLGSAPHTRQQLLRKLRTDTRGFYRDLEVLRTAAIDVLVRDSRYSLVGVAADALARLPFPDPHLTLGDVAAISKGRSAAHRRLRQQIAGLVP